MFDDPPTDGSAISETPELDLALDGCPEPVPDSADAADESSGHPMAVKADHPPEAVMDMESGAEPVAPEESENALAAASPDSASPDSADAADGSSGHLVVMEADHPPEAATESGAEPVAPEENALAIDSVVEALLFTASEPLTAKQLAKAVRTQTKPADIIEAANRLNAHYLETGRAFEIAEVAEKFKLCTRPEYARHVRAMNPQTEADDPSARSLTPAALDALAIVAYRQPVTRAEVKDIRGVESDAILRSLVERGLVKVVGRKTELVGQPALFGTTEQFLLEFGLPSLDKLPMLEEMKRQLA